MEKAMRLFLSSGRLIGENQTIERCINSFATKYFTDASAQSGLKNSNVAITLAYSIMILHTDLHHKVLQVILYCR